MDGAVEGLVIGVMDGAVEGLVIGVMDGAVEGLVILYEPLKRSCDSRCADAPFSNKYYRMNQILCRI